MSNKCKRFRYSKSRTNELKRSSSFLLSHFLRTIGSKGSFAVIMHLRNGNCRNFATTQPMIPIVLV